MTTDERLAKVAAALHHEGWPVEDGWTLKPETCGACRVSLRLAHALAPLLAEFAAQDRAAALLEAAKAWQVGGWADVLLPKPVPPAVPVIAYSNRVLDWLRDRAEARHEHRTGHESDAQPESGSVGHRDGTGVQRGDSVEGER